MNKLFAMSSLTRDLISKIRFDIISHKWNIYCLFGVLNRWHVNLNVNL